MTETSCKSAKEFYDKIFRGTVNCLNKTIENKLKFIETKQMFDRIQPKRGKSKKIKDIETKTIRLSLLDKKTKETHRRSGLNWGQREGRDKNQAYIPIPANILRDGFFPPLKKPFMVLTDDGHELMFVVAQESGKALHTKENNALLGEYIRKRIDLESGEFVERKHLEKYGCTDISFAKLDEDTYLLDFRPNM